MNCAMSIKNIPLVNFCLHKNYISYRCSLCNGNIMQKLHLDIPETTYINKHFMTYHTFKKSDRNYLYSLQTGSVILFNEIYNRFGRIDGHRICYFTNIIESNPHFIYLVPEFSFSDILDQFDECTVPSWQLLTAMRNKPFSCLICDGQFESFPSGEVFAAHPCKS